MATMEELREGVARSLPEIAEISDEGLREKVVEAWALALSETQFSRIEEMECSGMIGSPHIPGRTQADHLRGVGRLARAMARELIELYDNELDIDPDMALAGGLLHDVGKPFFYDANNIQRWRENKAFTGQPPFRHTFYGAHIALNVGLPEEIAHLVAAHDAHMEGQYVTHSVYSHLVAHADAVYWGALYALGLPKPSSTPAVKGRMG